MKIAMIASEANPLIKTGGLGDVVYALSKELALLGEDVTIVMPFYKAIKNKNIECELLTSFFVHLSWRTQQARIYKTKIDGITYLLVDNNQYFDRDGIYGYFDDGERFAFFTNVCESLFVNINYRPDIIHVHDWQVGMLPCVIKENGNRFYSNTYFVLTIHNPAFQGLLPQICLNDLYALPESLFDSGKVRFKDQLSTLKSAIIYSDKITTVSKTHRDELLTPEGSMGLDTVLELRSWDFTGIVNGIDVDEFNPTIDSRIIPYTVKNFVSRKKENHDALLRELKLPIDDAPIFGVVSRLTWQKGMDLIYASMLEVINQGGKVAILGSGEKEWEWRFEELRYHHPEQVGIYIGYNDDLAHKIYAGSDFFLMPSLFEPCGIGQMIAQRYGTLPIVREVGGLKDTVIGYNGNNEDVANGLSFLYYNQESIVDLTRKALDIARDSTLKNKLAKNAMKVDNSWKKSAEEYQKLYHSLIIK